MEYLGKYMFSRKLCSVRLALISPVCSSATTYVYKTNNLTYYLTIENEKTYIRCFSDYQEITFEDFLKKLSYLECEV